MKNFSNYLSRADIENASGIDTAFLRFFGDKLMAGEFKPTPNSQGRSIRFTEQWDSLINNKAKDYELEWALESVVHMFNRLMIFGAPAIRTALNSTGVRTSDDLDKAYTELTEYIDAGNFPFQAIMQHEMCTNTGEYFQVEFQNWTPVIGNADGLTFIPCIPIEPQTKPHSLQIEFPTGDLVAMDWFRFDDGLQDWLKKHGTDKLPSLNANSGIIKTTELYASLGIVHCFVGNSSPTVFTGDGVIAVGCNWREYTADGRERYSDADEDGNESEEAAEEYEDAMNNAPAGMVDHGSVCTDLWWVTMMERSRLIEILVEQLGEENRAEIEEYAKGGFDVEIQVEPGKYTLHFDAHPSTFYPLLDDKTKFGIGTPYFALTKDPA